jgi:hypothetical protein
MTRAGISIAFPLIIDALLDAKRTLTLLCFRFFELPRLVVDGTLGCAC